MFPGENKIIFSNYDTAESVDRVDGRGWTDLRMKLKRDTVDEEEEDEEEEEERRRKRERHRLSSANRQANGSIGVESNAKDNRLAIALVTDLKPPSLGASDAERETARGQHTGGRGT